MYKKIITSSLIAATIILSGCGKDTSPTGSIMNKIEENKVVGEKNIAKIIKNFYKKGTENIKNPKCSIIEIKTEDAVEISIIETSKKYCGNIEGFEKEVKKVIEEINKEKGMAITFDMVNGREEFEKDGSFSKDEIDMYMKYEIPMKEANRIKNIERNKEKIENLYFKNGIKSSYLIKDWKDLNMGESSKKSFIEAGVKKPENAYFFMLKSKLPSEVKEWIEIGIKPDDFVKLSKKGLELDRTEFLDLIKEYKITAKQLEEYVNKGIIYYEDIKTILKSKISIEEYKKNPRKYIEEIMKQENAR
jgi:hypothetical protein